MQPNNGMEIVDISDLREFYGMKPSFIIRIIFLHENQLVHVQCLE